MWHEKATQIILPLSDKELLSFFVGYFKAPYYGFLISTASTNFADMVIVAERVKQGLKLRKIEHINAKPKTPLKKKHEELATFSHLTIKVGLTIQLLFNSYQYHIGTFIITC